MARLLVALLLCTAAPASAQSPDAGTAAPAPDRFLKVAAVPMNGFSVKPELLSFFTEHYAQALSERGAQVTTPAQIQALLGFERQRQLLGCEENSECMTEIASALGVDAIATGEIAFLDASYRINLKVMNATTGEQLTSASARATTKEEVADQIAKAAHAMAPIAAKKLGKPLRQSAKFQNGVVGEAAPVAPPRKSNVPAYACYGAGGVLAGGGALMLTLALVEDGKLSSGDRAAYPTFKDARAANARAQLMESLSYPAILAGLSLLAAGAVLYTPPPEAPVKAFLMPTRTGVYAGLEVTVP